jgi:hypothetical protein
MKQKSTNIQSETDWQRVMRMTDDEIDTSDIPELTDDFFKKARVRWPENKNSLPMEAHQR